MPDWFYRTIAQRCLDRLPDPVARALALGTIGALGRTAVGGAVIDFLGHMRPPDSLAGEKTGVRFTSRVGLGPWLDPEGRATRALGRFGAGFIEIGPVSVDSIRGETPRRSGDGIAVPEPARRAATALDTWRRRIARQGGSRIPVWVRIAPARDAAPDEARRQIEDVAAMFAPDAAAFVVERTPAGVALKLTRPWLHGGEPRAWTTDGSVGIVLDPIDAESPADTTARVRMMRARLGDGPLVVVAGRGDPADLRDLLVAGADFVEADGALLGNGPGVIKRTNELLTPPAIPRLPVETPAAPRCSWFWGATLGAALAGGGLLTLILALGGVLLPYDEHHLGLDAADLRRLLPRVHAFMAHDRATLAGTMLGLGAFYSMLAREGARRGQHWAQVAITSSALAGFASFFFFLGFGYFDPLHAFVSAVLLQFTLAAMITPLRGGAQLPDDSVPDARSDRAWKLCQWGQLLLVIHACGLLISGAVISGIGMTRVFVSTDLEFLCASAAEIASVNDRLVGVIAHDRASLGGMLLASGVAQLLATLWGFRRGRRWLWNGLLALGAPAYVAALGIHAWVGYTSAWHLAPALAGLALGTGGLALTAPWLRARA